MSEKKFDREYSTTFIREKQFLDACGVKYKFVKKVDGITIFKYEKTPRLFECLYVFFRQFYDARDMSGGVKDMEGEEHGL